MLRLSTYDGITIRASRMARMVPQPVVPLGLGQRNPARSELTGRSASSVRADGEAESSQSGEDANPFGRCAHSSSLEKPQTLKGPADHQDL